MNDHEMRLILVTGAPRSGTTAVGQMMSLAPGVGNLHEPFNYHAGLKQIQKYFEVPGSPSFSMQQLDRIVQCIRQRNLEFKRGVFPADTGAWRIFKFFFGGRAKNSYRLLKLQRNLKTIVWKDPLACFAADHVAKKHQVEVLVTLRHPWAVAASFKRMEWALELSDIIARLKQAGMDFTDALAFLRRRLDISVVNGVVLWQVIYSTLYDWAQQNRRIRFVNLDHLVRNPIQTYTQLYEMFGLVWNERVAQKITNYYNNDSARAEPRRKKAHDRHRNVGEVNNYWQGHLTDGERDFVAEVTGAQWQKFQKLLL